MYNNDMCGFYKFHSFFLQIKVLYQALLPNIKMLEKNLIN